MKNIGCFVFTYIFISSILLNLYAGNLPEGFVYMDEVVPEIVIDVKYAGNDNFIGEPIEGYASGRCIITVDAAYALKRVQDELKKFGLGLKIFDAYRPQRAVDHFIRWAENTMDKKMKGKYYPTVKKSELFDKGYVSRKSGHSRGSTVDLTLIDVVEASEITDPAVLNISPLKSLISFRFSNVGSK